MQAARPTAVSFKGFPKHGKSGKAFFNCDDQQTWLVTPMVDGHTGSAMAAELVVERLARKLKVPVPKGEVVQIPQGVVDSVAELSYFPPGTCFGSLQFELNSPGSNRETLTGYVGLCTNPKDLPGIVLLDYWTWNVDRARKFGPSNYKNVMFTVDGTRRILAFDHGQAFGGRGWMKIYAFFERLLTRADMQYYKAFDGWLDFADFAPFTNNMYNISETDILLMMKLCPDGWGLSQGKKEKWTRFLVNRKDKVARQIEKQFG